MLLRIVFGLLVIAHGLVHLLYAVHAQRSMEIHPGLDWPDGSWAFSRLLGAPATRTVASVAYVLAAIGFMAGGLGILLGQAWFRPMVAGSAAFSAANMVLLWNGRLEKLSEQGAIGVLANIGILAAMGVL